MKNILRKTKSLIPLSVVGIMLVGALLPMAQATDLKFIDGFDKGPSFTSVVPLKEVTFVNFDKDNYFDDYAYLAAVPTTVFKENDKLYSYPLLYYQDKLNYNDDKYRILDAYEGIHYFMEDWMSYSGQLDQMTLINVPQNKLESSWKAKKYSTIDSNDPYEIASKLASNSWSYSDNAVIAVIEKDFVKPESEHGGVIKGVIPAGLNTNRLSFNVKKPEIGVAGVYQPFEIKEPYKYVVANMYWKNVLEDLDLQLYDDQLGMADADSKWNVLYGPGEVTSSYVYDYGRWEIGVTYMPTKSLLTDGGVMEEKFNSVKDQSSFLSALGIGKNKNLQEVTIDLYPGVDVELNDSVPFGCRNVEFKLKWNNPNVALGFVVLDTYGAETASAPSNEEIVAGVERGTTERVINLEKLGETAGDKKYKISVFSRQMCKQNIR